MDLQSKKAVSDPAEDQVSGTARGKKPPKGKFVHPACVVLVIVTATLFVASFLFPVMLVSGDSMEPGLNDGNLILLVKTHDLKAGDLVGFHWSDKTLLKRVIACSGDWVTIDNAGRVYVNGTLLDEPYVSEFRLGENDVTYPYQVPENSYFVLGDERKSSLDSRSTLVGCVRYDQIIGKGVIRIWPWR